LGAGPKGGQGPPGVGAEAFSKKKKKKKKTKKRKKGGIQEGMGGAGVSKGSIKGGSFFILGCRFKKGRCETPSKFSYSETKKQSPPGLIPWLRGGGGKNFLHNGKIPNRQPREFSGKMGGGGGGGTDSPKNPLRFPAGGEQKTGEKTSPTPHLGGPLGKKKKKKQTRLTNPGRNSHRWSPKMVHPQHFFQR